MTEQAEVSQVRQQLEGVQRAMAVPLPSPAELAAGKAEDRAMAERICATRPGIPLHPAFATLETLRVIQRLDTAKTGSDRSEKEPAPRRRDSVTDDHLRAVAQVYRRALEDGRPPTKAVALHFAAGHSTAARWVGFARGRGHLGATTPGTASA